MALKSNGASLQMMHVLLAKDWRLFRSPTIALLVVTLGSYGLGFVSALYNRSEVGEPRDAFFSASLIAVYLVPLLAAAFGGVAFAGERSERTADFLALLPVTRSQIVISKLVVSFFVLASFSVFNGSVALLLLLTNPRFHWEYFQSIGPEGHANLALWVACALCLFGVAWLFSTFSKSGPISACVSIGITVAATSLIAICIDGHRQNEWFVPLTIAVIIGTIGFSAIVGGTVYYLKRIVP